MAEPEPSSRTMLKTLTFTCEVLTPMFLAGADQNTCDLRAPSLRGALRYWYRALLGGQGITDLKHLKQKEADVFGDTERGSPVSVRIKQDSPACESKIPGWVDCTRNVPAHQYLWYFVKASPNDRKFIPPGHQFTVTFSTYASEKALQRMAAAFWLLANLGALGTRSRRMAGSFWVTDIHNPANLDIPAFAPQGDYQAWFHEQMQAIRRIVPAGEATLGQPSFDTLHPQHAKVWLVNEPKDNKREEKWLDVVKDVGEVYRAYRRDVKPKKNRIYFGLPLTNETLSGKVGDIDLKRRASPLWMRAVRLPSGKYDAVLTFFDSRFLPKEARIDGHPYTPPPATFMSDFVDSEFQHPIRLFPE